MTFNRITFFFVLLIIAILPFAVHKAIWLARAKKTFGTMAFTGKSQTGQIGHIYSVVFFMAGKDTVWFNGNDNILFKKGERIPIRYQQHNPKDARLDVFAAIWGDTLIYGGIPVLLLIVIFLDPKIIPLRSKIRLSAKKPVLKIIT